MNIFSSVSCLISLPAVTTYFCHLPNDNFHYRDKKKKALHLENSIAGITPR